MGGLFSLFNFLMFSGIRGNLVPGALVVLLKQMVIPLTMLISVVTLQTKFKIQHYIAVLLILSGIVISLWPSLISIKLNSSVYGIILVLAASIPLSVAIVFMEYQLKRKKLEIYWMWMWINFFEILLIIPLVFAIIPIQGVSIGDIPQNIENGYKCLLRGVNSEPGDACGYVGFWYLAFIIALVTSKVNQVLIIKFNSSSLMWLAASCAVPLAELAFSLELIISNEKNKLSYFLIIGLLISLIGILIYRSTKEIHKPRDIDLRIVNNTVLTDPN